MPQLTLYAPAIHCEHCIETIRKTVDATPGARFIDGSWEARRFNIEVASGAVLDAVTAALAAEEYPLGDAADIDAAPAAAEDGPSHPAYTVTRTEAGADLNYDCPCSCYAGFALDRSQPEQAPESCCCGRQMLVGAHVADRLKTALGDMAGYHPVDVQTVTMPWGQPLEVALATPRSAEHGMTNPAAPSVLSLDMPPSGGHH